MKSPTVGSILTQLEKKGSQRNVAGMARYGIVARKAFGVSVGDIRAMAKQIGRDHALAGKIWKSGVHEGRMLAVFLEDPKQVTPRQMDAWAREFENWADCDTACFHLFDKTPHAWKKIEQWSARKDEFVKRAAFALLASVAVHDKKVPDEPFVRALGLIEREARDERNFVKKAVSWALRSIGNRSQALYAAAIALAERLAASDQTSARWIGKDAIRDLSRPLVKSRIARAAARATSRSARKSRESSPAG
jgi:3-methyladenine DNA glycosylase AlkD